MSLITNKEIVDKLQDTNDLAIQTKGIVTINVANYSSISEAFNAIVDNSTILFPSKKYENVDNISTVTGKKNIRIIGYGAEIVCKQLKNSSSDGSLYSTPFHFVNCENVQIEGLKINGGFGTTTFQQIENNHSKLFYGESCSKIKFKDVVFTGHATNRITAISGSDSGILIVNSQDISFRDCIYSDNNMEGIWLESCSNILIDNLKAINPSIWTTLDIFKCDIVNIMNCNILARNGAWDDTATLNIYSSNISISNCILKGGSGIDLSDEANIFKTNENNCLIDNCSINAKYGFHQSGDKFINNVVIDNCVISAYFGLYLYHEVHRAIKNVTFKKCVFDNVISALKYRALGNSIPSYNIGSTICDNFVDNITFDGNIIYCKTIAESQVFQSWLGAGNGGSGAFVFIYEPSLTNGAEIVNNINIINNTVYCEGSLLCVPQSTPSYILKNFKIENNKVFNHQNKLTTPIEAPFTVYNIQGIIYRKNSVIDGKTINFYACTNISIINNNISYINTTQSTRGYYLTQCSGIGMFKDNIGGTLLEHFQGYQNSFSNYILKDNIPATYTGITAT